MSLINWRPFHQIDDLFDDKIARDLAVDIYQEKDTIIVKMQIPGIDPDKIDISVEGEHLIVAGSRQIDSETEDQQYYHREIRHGSFERIVPLPAAVEASEASAEHKNGVLKISLPIKNKKSSARITINKQ